MQSLIALSSADAELYAMVSAASEGLGSQAMALDVGKQMGVDLFVDASAAIGVAQRTGLGNIRHLDTQSLWIQDAVRQSRVSRTKVQGAQNPADMLTKHLDSGKLNEIMARLGVEVREGRAEIAPNIAVDNELNIDDDDFVGCLDVLAGQNITALDGESCCGRVLCRDNEGCNAGRGS